MTDSPLLWSPWDVLGNVVMRDEEGAPIAQPMTGYSLFLLNKVAKQDALRRVGQLRTIVMRERRENR